MSNQETSEKLSNIIKQQELLQQQQANLKTQEDALKKELTSLQKIEKDERQQIITEYRHGRPQDLDILVHDNDWLVRCQVAKQKRHKDLDILVHDTDSDVRMAVAEQGRQQDLDILIHDKDTYVRRVAIAMFEKLKTERNP